MVGSTAAATPAAILSARLARCEQPAATQPFVEGRLDRVDAALGLVAAAHQAIDDHVDRTGDGQRGVGAVERDGLVADSQPGEPLGAERFEQGTLVGVLADIDREADFIARSRGQLFDGA